MSFLRFLSGTYATYQASVTHLFSVTSVVKLTRAIPVSHSRIPRRTFADTESLQIKLLQQGNQMTHTLIQ